MWNKSISLVNILIEGCGNLPRIFNEGPDNDDVINWNALHMIDPLRGKSPVTCPVMQRFGAIFVLSLNKLWTNSRSPVTEMPWPLYDASLMISVMLEDTKTPCNTFKRVLKPFMLKYVGLAHFNAFFVKYVEIFKKCWLNEFIIWSPI